MTRTDQNKLRRPRYDEVGPGRVKGYNGEGVKRGWLKREGRRRGKVSKRPNDLKGTTKGGKVLKENYVVISNCYTVVSLGFVGLPIEGAQLNYQVGTTTPLGEKS